ncbi:MAG TPA: DUF2442 domain-containing protein [Planctomycetota bacterium]|nr:DUF2442 domain-containing protein [Planctomycetota bacterium]
MNPRVRSVRPLKDHRLRLEFTNGEVGVFDCAPLLDFGVFRELRDPAYFRQARVFLETVAWPHEQDICPDTLYLDSKKTRRPRSPAKRPRRAAQPARPS